MMDYVFEIMAERGVYPLNQDEQEKIEKGVKQCLFENGIEVDAKGDYYRNYVKKRLDIIDDEDLKIYFINYSAISGVNQIAMEFMADGKIPEERKSELYGYMHILYDCSLKDKYIPTVQVQEILGPIV